MKSNQDKFICFVTGASGVGKSTLADQLRLKYRKRKDVTILNFDSIGVPDPEEMTLKHGSPSAWQRTTAKQWVHKMIHEVEEPIVILEGQVDFDYIHQAFEDYKFKNYKTILIDCDENEMIRRLKEERGQPDLVDAAMRNWREHLKKQAEESNTPVIDTSKISIEDTTQKFEELLGSVLFEYRGTEAATPEISIMNIDDYEAVYDLWINTPGMGLNSIDDSKAGIEKYLKRNPTTCFTAKENGRLLGVILSGHDGRRGYIHHTAVSEEARFRGIGRRLVEKAVEALQKEGVTKAAFVVFKNNNDGNWFWEKLGFTQRDDLIYRNKIITDEGMARIDT